MAIEAVHDGLSPREEDAIAAFEEPRSHLLPQHPNGEPANTEREREQPSDASPATSLRY